MAYVELVIFETGQYPSLMCHVCLFRVTMNEKIIEIDDLKFIDYIIEDQIPTWLRGFWDVSQSRRHYQEFKVGIYIFKSSSLHILWCHAYLVKISFCGLTLRNNEIFPICQTFCLCVRLDSSWSFYTIEAQVIVHSKELPIRFHKKPTAIVGGILGLNLLLFKS